MFKIIEFYNGVQVKMHQTEEEPHCGLTVMIPKMNYTIYGGWNWGPNNPIEPRIIETLIGAKEVLIANLKENIYKDGKNPREAVAKINDAIKDLLGKHNINESNMLIKKHHFIFGTKKYSCIFRSEWKYLGGWNSNDEINVKNCIEWWEDGENCIEWWEDGENKRNKNGILKQKFEFDMMEVNEWQKFGNGRTSKELANDIISQYVQG